MEEIWKDIEGYENYYQISNLGNIKNKKTNKIKSQSDINSVGYKRITLYKPVNKRFFVHRLVAYHFCDGYKEGLVVNHKDGNKQNNICTNLEWVTRSENDKHAYVNNLRTIQGNAIIQKQKSNRRIILKNINTNSIDYIFNNLTDCAKFFDKNRDYIRQCCKGKYKLLGKYKLEYEELT